MPLAAGAEGRTGGRADARLVDQFQRQRARIGKALYRAEEIERRLGFEESNPAARREALAKNVARAAAALDLAGEERLALGQRRDRGAWVKTGTPDEVNWMRFSIAAASAGGASSQPTRKPVIAQFFDSVWTNRILSSGAITSWNEGARAPS